ncbi:ATP-binding domain-containing protein [Sorangium cellulosum]|uniref:DNA 3'-5' helicase II n=1 Tax=Sorangium cellulosum TaxID=56 RepID=A0A150QP97_SORCE|nr:ATP-binding domain-containing protein [Sorangium cellulosum]KYF69790.1 DNA helicase [Sorangium cellulosum]
MLESRLDLPVEARAVLEEEEALLERVRGALDRARRGHRGAARPAAPRELRSIAALRELRDEAAAASADDLPAVLLEMSVRQRLIEQETREVLPDPLCPYLAHLRVDEGKGAKDYLLGHATFLDPSADVRILDWRVAPVAQIFYRYREGDEYEETFPGRVAEGVVKARRIVVVERGALTRIVGDGLVLTQRGDGRWALEERASLAMQPGGAGTAARPGSLGVGAGALDRARTADVTALLDPEQYAAVCAPAQQPLLVLGSAGSGKTTVALHRLARIAALDPARCPLSAMSVVVPEEGLARLSRRLLAPLGAGEAQVKTLDAWSAATAREVFGRPIALCVDPPALVSSLKRHPALYRALSRGRFAKLAPASTTLPRLRRRLADVFTDRGFLEGVVAASGGDLPRSAVEETVRHTVLQLAEPLEKELASIIVPEMKRALDGRPIAEGTPDELAGTVDVDDLPILLFLRAARRGLDGAGWSHLVLDEAEDISLFELFVLGKLLGEARSVTLAGDEAQQTSSSFAGWDAALSTLGVGDAATCRLAVSYRCPRPVAELAQRLLGKLAPEAPARAARDGAPVGLFRFPGEAQAHLFLAGALRDLACREPRASVAVIARDAEAARQLHALVADLPEARLVLEGEFSFEPGIDVTDVDSAKGLEFDYVVVPDATAAAYPMTDEARRRLHVAVTRASHQLWLIAGAAWSPLLADAAER